MTTLAGVALALPRYRRPLVDGRTLEAAVADQAMGDLFALGREGLAAHPCVGPERVEFVLPGCAVFEAIRRVWPARAWGRVDDAAIRPDAPGKRNAMIVRVERG